MNTIRLDVLNDIVRHVSKACDKHPYFADKWTDNEHDLYYREAQAKKDAIKQRAECGDVSTRLVLNAEVAEIFEAITRGDFAAAREEIFDAIAVLIRMVNVMTGVETFGDPNRPKVERRCKNFMCPKNDSRGVCLRCEGVCKCANCVMFDICADTQKGGAR